MKGTNQMKTSKKLVAAAVVLIALGVFAPPVIYAENLTQAQKDGCADTSNVCSCCADCCRILNQGNNQTQVNNCKMDCTTTSC
jgi:hypothetical protein